MTRTTRLTIFGWAAETVLCVALAVYLVARSTEGWVAYDQFREMWGATRFVLGFGIPTSGGAAAGVGAASPLTSYLYSLAFSVWFDERSPYVLSSIALSLAAIGVFWRTKSQSLRFGTLLILASPFRLTDIRSGTDVVFLSASILALAAYGVKSNYALVHSKDAFAKGLLLGLLPHLHISGIFPMAAFLLRYTQMQPHNITKKNGALFLGVLLPLSFWLVAPQSIDGDSRSMVFSLQFHHWKDIFAVFFQSVIHHDLTQFRLLELPAYFSYVYRTVVFGAWCWLLLPILRTRNWVMGVGVLLAFWLVILGRTDYVSVGLFIVAQPTMLILVHADNRPSIFKYYVMLTVALIQLPLLIQLQETAVARGYYHVPMTYYAFTESNVYAGTYPLTLELPTARARAERYAARQSIQPISGLNSTASVDDVMAFFSTGMLHLHDLGSEDPACMDLTTVQNSYCTISHTTRMFESLNVWGLSFARFFSHTGPLPDAHPEDYICTLGEFANRKQCPECVLAIQSVPWVYRRSSLGATCISAKSELGTKLARNRHPQSNYFMAPQDQTPGPVDAP